MTVSQSTPPHFRRNVIAWLIDAGSFGAGINFIHPPAVLPALARPLTTSQPVVGLVMAVWNGAWLIPQLLAAQALAHRTYKKLALVAAGLMSRPAFLVIGLALLLGLASRPGAMIALLVGCTRRTCWAMGQRRSACSLRRKRWAG